MKRGAAIRTQVTPWGGLIGGIIGAGIAHQVGSDSSFYDCSKADPLVALLAGLVGLVLIAAGAFASWTASRGGDDGPARRLVAQVSLGTATLLALFVLLSMIAALVIPPCHA